jgi:hypothetical protein
VNNKEEIVVTNIAKGTPNLICFKFNENIIKLIKLINIKINSNKPFEENGHILLIILFLTVSK